MTHPNFDRVAPFYDWLVRIVFGSRLKHAQTAFLDQIKAGDRVLIVGGGTGWILEELNSLNKAVSVVYVESSLKMMEIAKTKKEISNLAIEFVQQPLITAQTEQTFDVVCTFFFLDLFGEDELWATINWIKDRINPGGKWLFADFHLNVQSPFTHRLLVAAMIFFFRLFSNVQSKTLVDYQQLIISEEFDLSHELRSGSGLIVSSCLNKRC